MGDIGKKKTAHARRGALCGRIAAVSVCLSVLALTACGGKVSTVIEQPVFKVGSMRCGTAEARVILMNYQKEYSNLYGIDMWAHDYGDGQSLEEYIKDLTLAQMAQVYTLDVIAKEQEVSLTEEEQSKAAEAANTFVSGLNEEEAAYLDVSEKEVQSLYENYMLADKMYETIKNSVNQEVSDDEARVIRLKQIYTTDEEKAKGYLTQLQGGTDFETLAQTANEAENIDLTVNRTTYADDITQKLFALTDGQISDVVANDGGYAIYYCVSSFDAELTEAHKPDVLEQRMTDAVSETYADYTEKLSSKENTDVWEKVAVDTTLSLDSASFLEIYASLS